MLVGSRQPVMIVLELGTVESVVEPRWAEAEG